MLKKIFTILMVLSLFILVACYVDTPIIENVDVKFLIENEVYHEVTIEKGSLVEKPEEPKKDGYEFDDWYYELEDEVLFDFTKAVEENTVIFGKFDKNEDIIPDDTYYQVNFMVDGNVFKTINVKEGNKAEEPINPSKEGFNFIGWAETETSNLLFDFNQAIKANLELYAKFEEKPVVTNTDLTIYYINDLHGAILQDGTSMGLAAIANVVLTDKENNPDNTLFLGGGDLLQGQIISNYYDGASVIDILNDMQMDAFVLGNHEFDWGIEEVTQYVNGKNALQANFPFLGANIYNKASNALADDLDEYVVIEKQGIKIGVIGSMGYGLESSISYTRINEYKFVDPISKTAEIAEHLRMNEDADIVIAVNHHSDDDFNDDISKLKGNQAVDAIFNAHTHANYVYTVNNKKVIQSGSSGSHLGKLVLNYDVNTGVSTVSAQNLTRNNETRLNSEHPDIKEKVDIYLNEIDHLYDEILPSSTSYSTNQLAKYITDLMIEYTEADVAVHNYGGTRASIARNESISYSKLFQISPFDNTVVTVKVQGKDLTRLINSNAVSYRSGLSSGSINANTYYTLATNDYILGNNQTLREADEYNFTGVTLLDMFLEAVEFQKASGKTQFATSNEIGFIQTTMMHMDVVNNYYFM